ncbi:unnamed protein product [Heterobilharzia americana]|nr:unnamed protein product [Heterobilharzia americana]
MSNAGISLFIETNTDCNAAGSATWDNAGHHVTFSIYGPDEAKINEELTHRAVVDITVTPRAGLRTSKEVELEVYLNQLIERLIDTKEFPRSKFVGRLFIVTGHTNDPRTVAAAINAISLALLLSGLPLRATIAAVCHTIHNASKHKYTISPFIMILLRMNIIILLMQLHKREPLFQETGFNHTGMVEGKRKI